MMISKARLTLGSTLRAERTTASRFISSLNAGKMTEIVARQVLRCGRLAPLVDLVPTALVSILVPPRMEAGFTCGLNKRRSDRRERQRTCKRGNVNEAEDLWRRVTGDAAERKILGHRRGGWFVRYSTIAGGERLPATLEGALAPAPGGYHPKVLLKKRSIPRRPGFSAGEGRGQHYSRHQGESWMVGN